MAKRCDIESIISEQPFDDALKHGLLRYASIYEKSKVIPLTKLGHLPFISSLSQGLVGRMRAGYQQSGNTEIIQLIEYAVDYNLLEAPNAPFK